MFEPKLAADIADGMRIKGKRPSVRKVRKALAVTGNSGSLRRVAEVLQDWRENHGLSEFEADTGVPPEFQSRIDALTTALWDMVHRKAAIELEKERIQSATLGARLSEAEDVNRTLATENERLREQIRELDQKQDRRAREFWDRVVIGIGDMLKETGPLSTAEIFDKLPGGIRREWFYHVEPIRASTIAKKLKERGGRGRYVDGDGSKWRHSPPGDDRQALDALP